LLQIQSDVVLIDFRFNLRVDDRFSAKRVYKINRAVFQHVAIAPQENIASGEARAAKNHRLSCRSHDSQVRGAADADLTAGNIYMRPRLQIDVEPHVLHESRG